MELLDPAVLSAVANASPWSLLAAGAAAGVVILVDGKTGMRARRAEAKALQAENAALKAQTERLQGRIEALESQMLAWMRDDR
jgi:hypothetical protein